MASIQSNVVGDLVVENAGKTHIVISVGIFSAKLTLPIEEAEKLRMQLDEVLAKVRFESELEAAAGVVA